MRVTNGEDVTVELEGAHVTIPSETVAAMWLDRIRNEPAPPSGKPVLIGSRLHTGVFMGVVRLDDGTERGVIDLGEAPRRMNWADAKRWAEEQGGQLPPRRAQALMFANRAEGQYQQAWYWSCTQRAGYESYAWIQCFGDGDQFTGHKDDEYYVRAVRLVDPSVIR